MRANEYDRWYETPRGRWIGQCETELLYKELRPLSGESLLDVGCGTGFFTRALASRIRGRAVGVDINTEYVMYARDRDTDGSSYAVADARALPFRNGAFDVVVSVAALCFISDEVEAVHEILRVARRSFAIGLLNRNSLLWAQKGRKGGSGAYRGAHWHTSGTLKSLFQGLPVKNIRVRTAVHLPGGGKAAECVERILPNYPTGAFILAAGEIESPICFSGNTRAV